MNAIAAWFLKVLLEWVAEFAKKEIDDWRVQHAKEEDIKRQAQAKTDELNQAQTPEERRAANHDIAHDPF